MQEYVVFFRADATPEIGGGHIMRCLALSEELLSRRISSVYICIEGSEKVAPALGRSSFDILKAGENVADDIAICKKHAGKRRPIFIVDHYNLDFFYERAVKEEGYTVISIDDWPERKHDCNILLDSTFKRTTAEYAHLVPEDCTILAGEQYILQRSEFSNFSWTDRNVNIDANSTILISCGMTDAAGMTIKVLEELIACTQKFNIEIVLGKASPILKQVENLIRSSTDSIKLLQNVEFMSPVLDRAAIAIGASGSSTWERCVAGIPTITLSTAKNQEDIANKVGEFGATYHLGSLDQLLPGQISVATLMLLENMQNRADMSSQARKICDGVGCRRVVDAVLNFESNRTLLNS